MWILLPLMFLTGFVDSVAGGGGLISLSAFLAVGTPAHLALGTNKFSAFLGTGIAACLFIRKGHVRWKTGVLAFVGALAGSAGGARLAMAVDERVMAWIVLAIVPAAAVFILAKKDLGARETPLPPVRAGVYAVLIGVIVGGYDGFVGPGTGTFLIIAFTVIQGMDILSACGTAKLINFASNSAAAVVFMSVGQVDYRLGIPCALCVMAGNFVGARLAMSKGVRVVRPMLIVVVALLLAKTAWSLL